VVAAVIVVLDEAADVEAISKVDKEWSAPAEHEPGNKYLKAFNERLGFGYSA
jgi:hypothetical protein